MAAISVLESRPLIHFWVNWSVFAAGGYRGDDRLARIFFGKFIDQVIVRLISAIGIKADIAGAAARWLIIVFSILAAAQYLNLQLNLLWPKFIDF